MRGIKTERKSICDELRAFREQDILDVTVPQGQNREYQKYTFSMYSGEVKRVTMRFRNNMMNSVIDKFGRQDFASPVDKDHFEITAFVAVSPQFYAWVFGLKNYVTIVSPPEVREGMKKHLEAVLKRYED